VKFGDLSKGFRSDWKKGSDLVIVEGRFANTAKTKPRHITRAMHSCPVTAVVLLSPLVTMQYRPGGGWNVLWSGELLGKGF
jgi:hypothetical protein